MPESPEQWARRQKIWRHNGLIGGCCMARAIVRGVQEAETTTDEAKSLAEDIERMLERLLMLLETRKEPSGFFKGVGSKES